MLHTWDFYDFYQNALQNVLLFRISKINQTFKIIKATDSKIFAEQYFSKSKYYDVKNNDIMQIHILKTGINVTLQQYLNQ